MYLSTDSPGALLIALVRARALMRHRIGEMANCPSCQQEVKDGYARDLEQIDSLIQQLDKGS